MRKFALPLFLTLLLLAATLSETTRGQGPGEPNALRHETDGPNLREIYGPDQVDAPQQPSIGFIDSPTAACYQPDRGQNACYLNWYYLSVSASPNYIITMTVTLNTYGVVANLQGFFQTSMYAPYNLFDHGFKVPCGSLGAGGNPLLGQAYAWTIRARDSAGLISANYGTTYCPAYNP